MNFVEKSNSESVVSMVTRSIWKKKPLSWQRRYNEMKWQMFQLRLNLKANSIQVPNYDEIQVGGDVIRHDQSALETRGQTPDIRFPRDLWQVAAIPLTIDL